jgi:hypothetical protein
MTIIKEIKAQLIVNLETQTFTQNYKALEIWNLTVTQNKAKAKQIKNNKMQTWISLSFLNNKYNFF